MRLRENTVMKALAFIMAVVCFTAAAMMGSYQLVNADVLWGTEEAENSYTVRYWERRNLYDVRRLLSLYNLQALGGELGTAEEQELFRLEERLDREQTNLRWQARDAGGTVRWGSDPGEVPIPAPGLFPADYQWVRKNDSIRNFFGDWQETVQQWLDGTLADNVIASDQWEDELARALADWRNDPDSFSEERLDAVYTDADGYTQMLLVIESEQAHLYGPSVRNASTVNEYGYRYLDGEWQRDPSRPDDREETLELTLWLAPGLPADDVYREAVAAMSVWRSHRVAALTVTGLCALTGILLTVYLCVSAGHRRGREGISLNWFHRIPGDLLLAAFLGAGFLLILFLTESMPWIYYENTPMPLLLAAVGLCAAGIAAAVVGFLVTFTARCKVHTLLRNTVIWRFCAWCMRGVRAILRAVPLIWKAVLVGVVYLLVSVLFAPRFLWILVTLALLAYLCLWAYQWKRIRQGTREIIGGHTDHHIDTGKMLPDLKGHADELNNLGQSITAAVEERLRAEHFKAELITNVSHDLKTPLTSIINYVDLLKKEDIGNPKAAEYIEVLDRKSQRLKKLTEDLVEASKASTGVLTVELERLDLAQLADQALAEYEERLAQTGLAVVRTLPGEPVWVKADGRHLWRVLDNLLSNCAKYALEGTRVYVQVQSFSDCAVLSVKNISREALGVPPERLVERFVRGDESRAAEGSGLGLSIAQSLTELQHGGFQVSIDGDLFKATVTLPLAEQTELI